MRIIIFSHAGVFFERPRRNNEGRDFLSLTDIPINARFIDFQSGNRKIFSSKLNKINIQESIMLGQYEALYNQSIELIHLLKKEYRLA